jgi:hypothetical protein
MYELQKEVVNLRENAPKLVATLMEKDRQNVAQNLVRASGLCSFVINLIGINFVHRKRPKLDLTQISQSQTLKK